MHTAFNSTDKKKLAYFHVDANNMLPTDARDIAVRLPSPIDSASSRLVSPGVSGSKELICKYYIIVS